MTTVTTNTVKVETACTALGCELQTLLSVCLRS